MDAVLNGDPLTSGGLLEGAATCIVDRVAILYIVTIQTRAI